MMRLSSDKPLQIPSPQKVDASDMESESDERSEVEASYDESEGDSLAFEHLEEDFPFKHLLTTNKAPSTEEEKGVHQQILGSNRRLQSIRKQIERFQQKIWDLEDQEAEEQRRNGSYQRVLAPVKRIPDEMLGEIFKHLHSVDEGFPPSISLVCALWRQVILKTPRLWTTIHIFPTPNSIELAKLFAERCGPTLPIRMFFKNWERPEDHSFDLSWLAPYRPRIEKLSVSILYQSRLRHFDDRSIRLPVIQGDSFDGLDELELEVGDDDWESVKFSLWKSSSRADSLRRLRLVNLSLPPTDISICLNRLTHLSLKNDIGSDNPRWNLRQVLEFLANHTQLQSVDFHNITEGYGRFGNISEFTAGLPRSGSSTPIDLSQYPSAESERITLPNLTSLSITFGQGTAWFLERLAVPGLRHLELKGAVCWVQSFHDMAKRSSFSLERFTMIQCTPFFSCFGPRHHAVVQDNAHELETRQEQVIDVLKSSPTIRMFKVIDSMFLGTYLVKGLQRNTNSESLIGPNLQHLWVSETKRPRGSGFYYDDIGFTKHTGREKILQMLASRQTDGKGAEKSADNLEFKVYHSGHPCIPVSRMSLQELYNRYQGPSYETSRHVFF